MKPIPAGVLVKLLPESGKATEFAKARGAWTQTIENS